MNGFVTHKGQAWTKCHNHDIIIILVFINEKNTIHLDFSSVWWNCIFLSRANLTWALWESDCTPQKWGRQAVTVTLTFYLWSSKSKINSSPGPNTHFGKFKQQRIFCILSNLFLQSTCSSRCSGCHWQNSIFTQILISITLQWYQSFFNYFL